MNSLWIQIASGLCWVVYGSFFEWYWHKLWMHTPRTPKEAFRGHTIVHHGLYKGDQSYFVPEGEHPEHILLKPYALPGIFVAHLPVILLINYLIPHTAIGGALGIVLYFVVYEYMHWNMHVPRKHFVERFRWFQFLRHHHHLHHKYYQKNFCVLFPLADVVLGTLITDQIIARNKADREKEIANGVIIRERNKPRRADREARALAKTRLTGNPTAAANRRERKVEQVRAMLKTAKDRNEG